MPNDVDEESPAEVDVAKEDKAKKGRTAKKARTI